MRWFLSILLFILAGLLIEKGMDLAALGTDVDGDGIGVYFLGAEINDRVPESKIPHYAIQFYVAGGAATAIGMLMILSKFIPFLKLKPIEK
ncbi:hypothetical protein [Thalassobacillus hwangdonensis]|uniref:Sporulation protein n=1 Tax=Thalassobacillus hwangdonensis TaxID=546108 RepID=A0ABW3L180_9BACI